METDAADDAKDVMETKADLCLLVSWVWIYAGTFNAQPPPPKQGLVDHLLPCELCSQHYPVYNRPNYQ